MTHPRMSPETVSMKKANGTKVNGTAAVFRTTASMASKSSRGSAARPIKYDAQRGALHDPITGLPNEHFLLANLRMAAQQVMAEDERTRQPALIVVRIDRLADVGAYFGPVAKKTMLEAVARRLTSLTPSGGTLARTASHEFTYLARVSSYAEARLLAVEVETQLRRPILVDGQPVLPSSRIGISSWSSGTQDAMELLRHARLATTGSSQSSFAKAALYKAELREQAVDRMRLEAELSLALERHELRLEYQPMISIESGEVTGLEALLRWDHPKRGTVLPDEIIPLAEDTGLIDPIGEWVLTEACWQMAVWQTQFPGAESLTLNVNLSARQLEQPDLVHHVLQTLRATGLAPETLRLELTETQVVANEDAVERLGELQRHGIEIQLDDFGSGYSSLGYLGRLPIDSLKLDRSFVEHCETDSRSATILDAVVALARELGLGVTAEGIETREQAERIRLLACETGQGFFFHRPLDGEAVEELLVA